MKAKNIIIEIITLLIVFYFFYDGVYKLAYFENYGFWVRHAPFLRPIWGLLNYVVPLGEIVLSLLLLSGKYRVLALYGILISSMFFVVYVMSSLLFSHLLFWPYHGLWQKPTWIQIMILSLTWAWLALLDILLIKRGFIFKRFSNGNLGKTSL